MQEHEDIARIIAEGIVNSLPGIKPMLRPITLTSGIQISVQAGCTWRCDPQQNFGPYERVEVMFREESDAIEHGGFLRTKPDADDIRVFPNTPVIAVASLILNHGGFAASSETDGERLKLHGVALPLLCNLN